MSLPRAEILCLTQIPQIAQRASRSALAGGYAECLLWLTQISQISRKSSYDYISHRSHETEFAARRGQRQSHEERIAPLAFAIRSGTLGYAANCPSGYRGTSEAEGVTSVARSISASTACEPPPERSATPATPVFGPPGYPARRSAPVETVAEGSAAASTAVLGPGGYPAGSSTRVE